MGDPCIDDFEKTTFTSQSTYILPIDPDNGKYLYMGDRWISSDLRNSKYIWLPLVVTAGGAVEIRWSDEWFLNSLNGRGAQQPVITAQPASAYYRPGTPPADVAALSVTATSPDNGVLSYQWYKADTEAGLGEAISGAKQASYNPVIPATLTDGEQITWYWAVVTNTNNNVIDANYQTAAVKSGGARITVTDSDPLKLHFTFDNANGSNVLDNTGTYTGKLMDGASIKNSNGIKLLSIAQSGQWFDLSANAGLIITDNYAFSISTYLYVTSFTGTRYPWSFTANGTIDTAWPGVTGNPAIVYQIKAGEQEVDLITKTNVRIWVYNGTAFASGKWAHVVYTQDGRTGTLYYNGSPIAVNSGAYTSAQGMTGLVQNFLGKSPVTGSSGMVNTFYADFRMYNTAMPGAMTKDLGTELQGKYGNIVP
jgi:hypothetical protein